MGINRRRSNRRVFRFNKNYIIPFVCILVTCTTLIVSTCIIVNLQKQIPVQSSNFTQEKEGQVEISINDNEKKQINSMFSFLMSNIDMGQELSNENVRYMLVCKYYAKNSEFNQIDIQYIDGIKPEVYRDLGYVYFDDYKDTYMSINKEKFIQTYKQLFNTDILEDNTYSTYYIQQLEQYLVPKNNNVYNNSIYKVKEMKYDEQTDSYTATMLEVNVLKLYEEKEYLQVEQYLDNIQIDNNYLTGKMLKIQMKKIDNTFVFDKYVI